MKLETQDNQYLCPLCDELGTLRVAIEAQLAMPLSGAVYNDTNLAPCVFKQAIEDKLPYATYQVCDVFCISCGAAIKDIEVNLIPLAHELLGLERNRE